MAEVKHGTVSVTVADHLQPDPRAGTLTNKEVQRLPKARRGVGLVCQDVADGVAKAGTKLTLPGQT
jgi:hypothetical protein